MTQAEWQSPCHRRLAVYRRAATGSWIKQLLTLGAQPLFQIAHRPVARHPAQSKYHSLMSSIALLLIRQLPSCCCDSHPAAFESAWDGAPLSSSFKEIVNDQPLRTMLDAISTEVSAGGPGWREMIKALVEQLSLHLLRTQINTRRSTRSSSRVGVVDEGAAGSGVHAISAIATCRWRRSPPPHI